MHASSLTTAATHSVQHSEGSTTDLGRVRLFSTTHTHLTNTSWATMDLRRDKKCSRTPFTYLSKKGRRCSAAKPPERCSHASSGATLPARFSIKQANNTIPTPINKWSFLNKVMYTGPLTEAPHHSFMGLCFAPSEERGSRGMRETGNKGNRDVVEGGGSCSGT